MEFYYMLMILTRVSIQTDTLIQAIKFLLIMKSTFKDLHQFQNIIYGSKREEKKTHQNVKKDNLEWVYQKTPKLTREDFA